MFHNGYLACGVLVAIARRHLPDILASEGGTNFDLSCGVKENGDTPYWENYISKKSLPFVTAVSGFDPAMFVTFINEKHLVRYGQCINRDHPYIQWFLTAYPILHQKFEYYSKQLIYMLFKGMYRREQQYEQINVIMDRLRKVLPYELRPPIGLKLTETDFNGRLGNSWNV